MPRIISGPLLPGTKSVRTGPQKGNPYGPRHNENCLPVVVAKEVGGYGIATWAEQSTEEQCGWIKRYLYENDECCFSDEQKATRKVKVCRWTGKHKKDVLAPAHLRAVEIYYEHYQLKHNLREKDRRCAELRQRLDVKEKIYWDEVERSEKRNDENHELKAENERLKKQVEAMSDDSKVLVDRVRYRKLMRIHHWVKDRRGQTHKILDRDQDFVEAGAHAR
tara:strand:+ start:713 stop:1375 length:663 start_codon:yes stop_codon:yes gene_type:complete